ncbi:MAG TPA: SusC/RagA family TonB-linked outer membrane protein [Gemmatimonadaceae bacterium]
MATLLATLLALAAGAAVIAPAAHAQGTGRITGTVRGSDGQPVANAQVTVSGTSLSAIANDSGRYTIGRITPGTYAVRAQRIGYQSDTRTVTVTDGAVAALDFQLTVLPVSLTAQVVVGYTTEKRRDISGAVSSVSGSDIRDQKVPTLEQALEGHVTGVHVASSGEPGRPAQIVIRGQNGFGNPAPLYVVDGMYLTENPNLNPDDIESIEVLKDASAAAQYGAQASNGVIVIRTRRGHAGRNEVQAHLYYGVQDVPKRIDMMNASQWAALTQQAYTNAGLTPPAGAMDPGSVNTDWQDAVFQRGAIQDYNLQVSGGTPTASWLVSGGVLDQSGTIITTNFRRYSFRVNSSARIGRLEVGENTALSQGRQQGLNGFPLIDVVRMVPTIPVHDPNNPGGYGFGTPDNPTYGTNPVGELEAQTNNYRSNQVIGTAYGDVRIFDNLHYRLNLGLNYNDSSTVNWRSIDQLRYLSPNPFATLTDASANGTSLLWENLLNFDGSFGSGRHRLNAVVGTTSQKVDFSRLAAFRQGFSDEDLQQIDAGSTAGSSNSGFAVPFRTNAVLGRANYTFLDRYLLSGSVRRDCSSRFSPGDRCGNFGAGSIGWVMSEEGFFHAIPGLGRADFFKLRASTGVLGDQNIGNFAYLAPIVSNVNYIFDGSVVAGAIQQSLANPNLKWQRNRSSDVGLDLGLFGNALSITADYYSNTSDQLLVSAPIPPSLGSSTNPTVNAGRVRNWGFELGASHHLDRGAFQLNTTLNLTTTRNKVLSLGNGGQPLFAGISGVARTAVGQPIGEFYVKHVAGIFQSQEEIDSYVDKDGNKIQPSAKPGDIRYADLNGDGIISDKDRYNAGNGIPKLQAGLFLDARYHAFDVGVNLRGAYGYKIFNVVRWWTDRLDDLNNSRAGLTPWTPDNPSTTTPRAVYGPEGAANGDVVSDRWLENGNFTRIQNLIVGYTLPARLTERFNGGTARVYVNIQNLHTFTQFTNWDPEILGFGDPLARGIDDGFIYPNPRSITFGLDLHL